jgi:hypothetical protein
MHPLLIFMVTRFVLRHGVAASLGLGRIVGSGIEVPNPTVTLIYKSEEDARQRKAAMRAGPMGRG